MHHLKVMGVTRIRLAFLVFPSLVEAWWRQHRRLVPAEV
jgi:hypothetical protein